MARTHPHIEAMKNASIMRRELKNSTISGTQIFMYRTLTAAIRYGSRQEHLPPLELISASLKSECFRVLGDLGAALIPFCVTDRRFKSSDQTTVEIVLETEVESKQSLEKLIFAIGQVRMIDSIRVSLNVVNIGN
jgi:hypothetical protein